MEHDWGKAALIPAVGTKTGTQRIWRVIFMSPSSQGGTTPKFYEIAKKKLLVHLSRRLKCTIVIIRCPSSVVRPSSVRR